MKIFSILCVITTIAAKTSTLFDHENLVFISKNKREREFEVMIEVLTVVKTRCF